MSNVAAYASTEPRDRDDLVMKNAGLVKRIASHMRGRLPPEVQIDDLIQAGLIGLLEATRNYDASQGASFQTYATIRIRGAMLDEVRNHNWTPRSVFRKARVISEAIRAIENDTGRDAVPQDVARALDISIEEYHQLVLESSGHALLSLEDEGDQASDDGSTLGPFEHLQKEDFKASLRDAIESLPERERLVLSLYYDQELTLREIGEVLGVTESRVCQIHGQAALRLRARLQDWTADGELT